ALLALHGVPAGWWSYTTGLEILSPGVAIGLAGVATGGLWLARALSRNESVGWKFGVLGLAGSLVLVLVPLNQLRLYLISPPIHDISTDSENAPVFDALLPLRIGAQNGPEYDGAKLITYSGRRMTVAEAQKKAYPDIRPYPALLNPRGLADVHPVSILFWRSFERAKEAGFDIVAYNEKEGTIEATHTSFWFGLVQDIAIRVRPAGKIGARIDIRIKSRTGQNDMGMSAQIVRDYMKSVR
ncbi:MAG: DUF1499 domain-containing protein, partial [Bradyrhizobium sp.]